jgi:hypothetical protein
MVYAPMFYAETADSLFNKVNTLEEESQEKNPTSITFAGRELKDITGPVPLVDLAYTFNRDGAGHLRSVSTRITLSGKLLNQRAADDPAADNGVSPVLDKALNLESHFLANDGEELIIKCGEEGTETKFLGCRIADISVNKTGDNWVRTADYSITLESKSGAGDCSHADSEGNEPSVFYVDNPVDSWSMEPIEDFIGDVSPNPKTNNIEWHNPFNSPGGTDLSADPNSPTSSPSVTNSPHFRVSHRVSAVGFTTSSNTNAAYLNAKAWVDSRLNLSKDKNDSALATPTTGVSGCSGMPHIFKDTTGLAGMVDNSTVLYNHNRQISYSVTDGSYEVSDTWLAMPVGQKSIEEYSIEVSTDERYIKTVRVQGNIKGLYIRDIIGGGSGPSSKGSLVLGPSGTSSSTDPALGKSKYDNAENSWISGIKPYLFSRAMSVMGGADRTVDYVNPTNAALSSTRPNNPIFSKERALNPIPVSTTEGHDHRKGTITYSYEFTNRNIVISGAISSSLSINDTGPTDVISENFVIGRALGPIIQSMGTTTSSRKDVSIDLTVFPPMDEKGFHISNVKCPMYTGGYLWNKVNTLVDDLAPAGSVQYYRSANNYSWSPIDGRFTLNKSWIYQSCTAPAQWPMGTYTNNNNS